MTADSGKSATAIITRCLQVLQLAMDIVSAVLQSALVVVKSTYQLLRPQPAKSLAGEIVLVCIMIRLIVDFAELGTSRATLQGPTAPVKNKRVLVRVHMWSFRNRPEQDRGVSGRLRPRIFVTFGTTRVVGRQPYAPTALTPGEMPGTHYQGWVDPRAHGSVGGGIHGKNPQ